MRKVIDLAARKKIPVQAANSRGGNDGSVFVAGGAVDVPLSWPGAHAHSFVEKIYRRDLEALTALIRAVVTEFE
ncbi:MAG: M42 family metallopeptidase [Candidatus Aminicenantes bacterium]|nr:M42 family metallopeptidase [Candidatus Aminicenantes bacterium]